MFKNELWKIWSAVTDLGVLQCTKAYLWPWRKEIWTPGFPDVLFPQNNSYHLWNSPPAPSPVMLEKTAQGHWPGVSPQKGSFLTMFGKPRASWVSGAPPSHSPYLLPHHPVLKEQKSVISRSPPALTLLFLKFLPIKSHLEGIWRGVWA